MTNNSNSKVFFFFESKNISLKNRKALKQFIESIFKRERKKLESINFIFCSDEYLLEINKQYLNHDFYTDIISFDLSVSPNSIIGDIYISTERVRENAKALKTSIKDELNRVIFHGALHLCGFKDKTTTEIKRMREKEEEYLTLYSKSTCST